MSDFKRKKVAAKTLSEHLRLLRNQKGYTKKDMAQRTKIRLCYICALEEGDYQELPCDVYVRGFVDAYAKVLNVDSKPLLRLYEREYGIRNHTSFGGKKKQSAIDLPLLRRVKPPRAIITSRVFVSMIALVSIIGIILYLYSIFVNFIAEPFLVVHTPLDGSTVNTSTAKIVGKTNSSANVKINNQPVIIDRDGVFDTEVTLSPGANTLTVIATNRFDKISERKIAVYFDDSLFIKQKKEINQLNFEDKSNTLDIKIIDADTWLSVIVDGEKVLTETIPVGQEHSFEGRKIIITSGSGKRTLIRINEKEFKPLSDSSAPVKNYTINLSDNDNLTGETD